MNTLTAEAVLRAWEQAQGAHPLRRTLALLRTAWPEVDAGQWATLPMGALDDCLFSVHEALFGTGLDTVAACPSCGEALQLALSTRDLRVAPVSDAGTALPTLSCEGWELSYRLPGSEDLLAAADVMADNMTDKPTDEAAGPRAALARLLERCVVAAHHGGTPASADALPAQVVQRLQQDMAHRDPGADNRVSLHCPCCDAEFERRFDIGEYLWDEVDDWCQHTLAEVHLLAGAYGWSEAQILALSAWRRQHYLALVQA